MLYQLSYTPMPPQPLPQIAPSRKGRARLWRSGGGDKPPDHADRRTHLSAQRGMIAPNIFAGIALRLLAMLALALMFVVVKKLAASGMHIAESLFWRQALALPFVLAWAVSVGGWQSLATRRLGAHGRRAAMGLAGMAMNFGGMILLPMAEAATISMTVPIFAVIFAALLLREPVGPARWTAVALGFLGVIVVLRPGGGGTGAMGIGALVALGGALMTALITVAVRDLGRTETTAAIVFWFMALSLVPLMAILPFVITSHSTEQIWLLAALGASGAVVQLAMTGALRLAPVAAVMPMDYSSLLWSLACGWWFFGSLPAAATWAGAPLIVASGLVIAWREHRRSISRTRELDI